MQKEPPRVFVFLNVHGEWLVTVSNRGGKAPTFKTEAAAEEHAKATAEKLGLTGYTKL